MVMVAKETTIKKVVAPKKSTKINSKKKPKSVNKKKTSKKAALEKKSSKPASNRHKVKRVINDSGSVGQAKTSNLAAAKAAKEDEFYTQLADIERELTNYRDHFAGKVVYCNCDDPRVSGFVHYFSYNFERLKIKKLIATCYKNQNMDLFSQHDNERAVKLVYTGDKNGSGVPDPSEFDVELLEGDGDFRSSESIALLKQADIVVTNPPFSLYREYVTQLIEHGKKFILVGPQNAITTKDIFPLIIRGEMWLGTKSGAMKFRVPYDKDKEGLIVDEDGNKFQNFGNICWYTNLDYPKRHEDLILYKSFNATEYPKYDNFDAIEVGKVSDIPFDYDGVMGVPITFLDKHNPEQFEIVGITKTWFGAATKTYPKQKQISRGGSKSDVTKLNDGAVLQLASPPKNTTYYMVDGGIYIQTYPRILIKKKV
jgi:hypothetical protein